MGPVDSRGLEAGEAAAAGQATTARSFVEPVRGAVDGEHLSIGRGGSQGDSSGSDNSFEFPILQKEVGEVGRSSSTTVAQR